MIVEKEINNLELARALKELNEKELMLALEPFLKKNKHKLLKIGKHRPFKPFKAIKMRGNGITASEMVIQDRI